MSLNTWQKLNVFRNGRNVILTLNGQSVYGTTPGELSGLTLVSVFLVGGAPDMDGLITQVGFSKGFQGCISEVRVSSSIFF